MKSKSSLRNIAAALFVSLGLASSAFAHPHNTQADSSDKTSVKESHRGGFLKGIVQLHDDLKLNAKQESLWQEAVEAHKESMKTIRERSRKHREETRALFEQANPDVRTLFKLRDEFQTEIQKIQLGDREHLFKAYDALNKDQKEKVRAFFKDRFDHRRAGKAHGHRSSDKKN